MKTIFFYNFLKILSFWNFLKILNFNFFFLVYFRILKFLNWSTEMHIAYSGIKLSRENKINRKKIGVKPLIHQSELRTCTEVVLFKEKSSFHFVKFYHFEIFWKFWTLIFFLVYFRILKLAVIFECESILGNMRFTILL
jgi:hypothetical protein